MSIYTANEDSNRRSIRYRRTGRGEVISGWLGNNIATDFAIPPASLADVDRALFNFFDHELNLQVGARNTVKPVPTIFAGGERFALVKSNRPIRDKRGSIIVPVISLRRTSIGQNVVPNFAFGVNPGLMTIKRRLHPNDRRYQQLTNRFGIKNQENLPSDDNVDVIVPNKIAQPGRIGSRRERGQQPLATALDNPLGDNIFEILTMPTPEFVMVNYEMTIWTNYLVEMNQIIQRIMNAYNVSSLPEVHIESLNGYWYTAYFEGDWTAGDNFDDYTNASRLIKTTMNIKVPAYLMAPDDPGQLLPIHSFVSAPKFEFEVCETDVIVESHINSFPQAAPGDSTMILSDIENIDFDGRRPVPRRGQHQVARRYVYNPFASSLKGDPRFSRVTCVTRKGERTGRIVEALKLEHITKP